MGFLRNLVGHRLGLVEGLIFSGNHTNLGFDSWDLGRDLMFGNLNCIFRFDLKCRETCAYLFARTR